MPGPTEWTLTADIKTWIDGILAERIDLPFAAAKVEERGTGSQKRRDITLVDRFGKRVLSGEIKMPWSPDGRTPFQESLVLDAHEKADNLGIPYFFTWNVNRCVLWQTFKLNTRVMDRRVQHWYVFPAPVRFPEEMVHPRVDEQIKKFLALFLERAAAIIQGVEAMPTMPPDERFVLAWESALEQPVAHTIRAMRQRYLVEADFTRDLDKWMREEQGWTISHKGETVLDNTERAAKVSCYILANKIIFHKALRKRFRNIRALQVPAHVTTAGQFSDLLDSLFEQAITVSRDYQTVFKKDFGDTLPLLSDLAVDTWRFLVQQTDIFDFTQLDYEVIGLVFERLLSTEERHKFGQHYTRSEVADLINTFCIRDANATVLDPACGGGTFLVRAYARKQDLSGGALTHQETIQQLYGLDIAAYPVHLTTINLATKHLIDSANYPRVARFDFFDAGPDKAVFHVPLGNTGQQFAHLDIGKVDAIVGNPPYVRQTKIAQYYGRKYPDRLRSMAEQDAPGSSLSGRSDIHCYFFTHSLPFLKDDGYLGLLTSSTWLDTTYGFALQKLLLDNFEIVAIFESNCEPWFEGARVTTAATILRRQRDPEKRARNLVRFVQLTKPLSEMLVYSPGEDDRRMTFEALRDRIESAEGDTSYNVILSGADPVNVREQCLDGMRVRVVNQADLYRIGCGAVKASEDDEDADDEDADENGSFDHDGDSSSATRASSDYAGSKWGIFLRAPAVFFKLLQIGGNAFVPLGDPAIASIKRGVTSGCDTFFFPHDVTEQALLRDPDPAAFRQRHGIRPADTGRIRIVQADGVVPQCIESKYLEPLVFNLMEIDSAEVDLARLRRRILLVHKRKSELRGTHVLKYIRWGELEGFDNRRTCRARQLWYALPLSQGGEMLWSMTLRYRYLVPMNPGRTRSNKRLFDIVATDRAWSESLAAVLNSTTVALGRYCYGRLQGGDPVIETEVVDVKMLPVPDPRRATDDVRLRLERALDSMRKRQIGHLVNVDAVGNEPSGDLAMPDRQDLDDAVLELIGVTDPAERRALRDELYSEITGLYRSIRRSEKRMQEFRSRAARKGTATPRSIAHEIWEGLEAKPFYRTPLDFVPPDNAEEVDLPEGRAKIVSDLLNPASLLVAGIYVELGHLARVRFAKALSDAGFFGPVPIPRQPDDCETALAAYAEYVNTCDSLFGGLADDHTSDEQMRDRVVHELWRLARSQAEHAERRLPSDPA